MLGTLVLGFVAAGIGWHLFKRSLIGKTIIGCFRIVKGGLRVNYYIVVKTYRYLERIATKLQKNISDTKTRKATKLSQASGDNSNVIPFPNR